MLKLALKLERGATNAYLGVIPSLIGTDLHHFAAQVACDESFHAAILANAHVDTLDAALAVIRQNVAV